jgi:hypothetical protein
MPLLSATDDFRSRTLAAIHGILRRLVYVAALRDGGGQYVHWGLSRAHGPQAANEAVAAAHSESWIQLLRTPLPQLVSELEAMDAPLRTELLAKFEAAGACSPDNLSGGTMRHFNSIVLVLRMVFRPEPAKTVA